MSQDLFSCFRHFIGIKPNQLWVLYLGQVNQLPGDFGQPLRLCLGPGSHRGVVGAAGVGVVVDTPPNPWPDLVRILEDAQRFAERRVEGPDLKGLQKEDSSLEFSLLHRIILSSPIARPDEVPSRLAILEQGKMTFLVPFLSSAGEMFVVCPKDQLQSGVGRPEQEAFSQRVIPEGAAPAALHRPRPTVVQGVGT